jgi:carnitine-CoA ligase
MTPFHELLHRAARDHGARPAVLFEGESVSYADLIERSHGFASGLGALGVSGHDHVALVMDNSLECLYAWLASSILGCTEVPINPEYRGELLMHLLKDAEVTVVVCDEHYFAQIAEVSARLSLLRLAIRAGGRAAAAPASALATVRYEEVCGRAQLPVSAEAPERVILYTSGTTGPSKGVAHSQGSCLTLARYNAEVLEYTPSDRLLNFFPLYHQNARYTGVIPALCAGAAIRIERRFSSSTFWHTCDRDGTTAFNYLGSILRLILNVTPPERVVGAHTIQRAFGAGASASLWEQYEKGLGIRLIEVYGLSEAPMATLNGGRQGRSPVGSAGRASKLFDVRVVDAEDREVEPDTVGEIVLRPRRPEALMLGYYNQDTATVRAFRNLWFHSGDRGRLSASGDLYFEERGKDSIRRRGENISAWEVESVLNQHPEVAESAVYGLPSEETDEEVAAALVLKRKEADLRDILRFAEARLPKYAVPTLFRVMVDLPRTPTAKIQKKELRRAAREGCISAAELRE